MILSLSFVVGCSCFLGLLVVDVDEFDSGGGSRRSRFCCSPVLIYIRLRLIIYDHCKKEKKV